MDDLLPKLVSVFGVAFFSLWASIPAGLALNVGVVPLVLTATFSYFCGAALIILPGERLRSWLFRRLGDKAVLKPDSLVGRAWARFGVAGLALLSPMVTGAQIGSLIGLTLNAPPRQLLLWMTLGGFVWTLILTTAISLGIMAVR